MPLTHLGFILAGVQQDSEGWDPRNMIREPSKAFQCYLLFLLVVCVVCVVKLIKVWKVAFPFALSRHLNSPHYIEFLQSLEQQPQAMDCSHLPLLGVLHVH
jgi:hypothetical protein